MNEDEDIASYILRFAQLVNTIRGLGEEVDEAIVVRKILGLFPKGSILRSLPYNKE